MGRLGQSDISLAPTVSMLPSTASMDAHAPSFPLRSTAGMPPLLISASNGMLMRSASEGLLMSGYGPGSRPATADAAARNAPFQLAPGVLARPRPPTSAAVMRLTKRRFAEAKKAAPEANLQLPRSASMSTLRSPLPDELKRALRGPKPRAAAFSARACSFAAL